MQVQVAKDSLSAYLSSIWVGYALVSYLDILSGNDVLVQNAYLLRDGGVGLRSSVKKSRQRRKPLNSTDGIVMVGRQRHSRESLSGRHVVCDSHGNTKTSFAISS